LSENINQYFPIVNGSGMGEAFLRRQRTICTFSVQNRDCSARSFV
jgi:hypothetical protein